MKGRHVLFSFAAFLIGILFIWESLHLLSNIILHKEKDNNLARGHLQYKKVLNSDSAAAGKPDIFFIIFDSYASSSRLLHDFHFSNEELDSLLIRKGFFISHHSRSNYPLTPLSVASTLNMDYLKDVPAGKQATAKYMLQGAVSVYESQLPLLLEKEGYIIYNYSSFDIRNHPAVIKPYFNSLGEKLIAGQTLLGRFNTYLLWNFTLKNLWTGHLRTPKSFAEERQKYIADYITSNITGLESFGDSDDSIHRFVYCHIMLPHEPYIFKADGSFQPDSLLFDRNNLKQKFLEQTIYTNAVIEHILGRLIRERKRPYVVILEGDHGYRDFDNKKERDKIFDNLNAYYFSDKQYDLLYDSISPVNTFRVVLNKYFKQHFGLLKDSSIYIKDPSFNFERHN